MKKYIFERREVWIQLVAISAESIEEAKIKIQNGEGTDIDDQFEYSGVLEDYGVDDQSDDDQNDTVREATEADLKDMTHDWWDAQ